MPTFERLARFDRDLEALTPQQRAAFLAAVRKFVDDLVAWQGFRKGLRVKGFVSRGGSRSGDVERGGRTRLHTSVRYDLQFRVVPWESDHIWVTGDAPPTPSQVKKAGDRIRRAVEGGGEPSGEDLHLLDVLRSWHGAIHTELQLRLGSAISRENEGLPSTEVVITGRPLKTREAIIAKLVRERSRLNRIQDIAGARVVVPDMATQQSVLQAVLQEFAENSPVIAKDTREAGDGLGYRGLHVVVLIAGRYAEIQIRTVSQGLWAQVVEKLDEVAGSDLKHGSGPEETLEWMRAFSERLRRVEHGEKVDMRTAVGTAVQSIIDMALGQKGDQL